MKKTLILLLAICIGFAAMSENNDSYEWKKYKLNGVVKTGFNGETINFAEIIASGKCLLLDVATVDNYLSWRRHESGILEMLQERFADQLYVVWIENRDNISDAYIDGSILGNYLNYYHTKGDWSKGVNNTPVNYHIINGNTVSYDYGLYFLAPSGLRCSVNLSDNASDAVQQIMRLIYNHPSEEQLPQIEISGPKRASVYNPERYTATITSPVLTMGIEWTTGIGGRLSCEDCGNPQIAFTNKNYNWFECVVRNQYGSVRKRVQVDVRDTWEKGYLNSYCMNDPYEGELAAGTNIKEYGIRLSQGLSTDNNAVVGARHYINTPGDYTLNIYSGGYQSPDELIFTKTYHVAESGTWHTFLTDTMRIDGHDFYWVTFNTSETSNTGAYSTYSGNPMGAVYSTGSSWSQYHDRAWMIKVMTIRKTSASIDYDISGPAAGVVGRTYAFHIEGPENATYRWSAPLATTTEAAGREIELSWNAAGHQMLHCSAVINGRQVDKDFWIDIVECPELLTVPMHESFEDPACQCWTSRDDDGDSRSWVMPMETADAYDEGHVVASASKNGSQSLTPDNWLISPRIHIPNGGADISWWDFSPNATLFAEQYSILVSTTGTDAADFVNELYHGELTEGQRWEKHVTGLNNFLDQDIYIAFVHNSPTAQDQLYIDNISITGAECRNIEPPYTENFENGDFTYCWRFVDGDGDHMDWNSSSKFFSGTIGHNSNSCAASASFYNELALNPDNWLVSPTIVLPEELVTLEWWEQGRDLDDYAEQYAVMLSTTGNSPDDFTTTLYENTINEPRTWRKRQVSLADYAGQSVYVAFRHYNCSDQFFLLIDDVKLSFSDGNGGSNGIDEVNEISVNVYPNPSDGIVHIDAEGLRRVELMDVSGRILQTVTQPDINLASRPDGLYFLRVTTQSGVTVKRIAKR